MPLDVFRSRVTPTPTLPGVWLAALLVVAAALPARAQTDEELAARLRTHRDRLLDGLKDVPGGQWLGKESACAVWKAMDTSQRYTFLRDTDLLGQRSLLYNSPVIGHQGDSPAMALDRVARLLWVAGSCPRGSWQPDGWCVDEAGRRIERQSCGGENNNRTFFQVDDTLIYAFRNFDAALPGWHASGDRGRAHKGFTHTSETLHGRRHGQATGQAHFYAWDHEPPSVVSRRTLWSRFCNERGLGFACGFGDGGPEWAARLVEIDVDFTRTHESSTVCYYSPYHGYEKYAVVWTGHTTGNGPAYDYDPCRDGGSAAAGGRDAVRDLPARGGVLTEAERVQHLVEDHRLEAGGVRGVTLAEPGRADVDDAAARRRPGQDFLPALGPILPRIEEDATQVIGAGHPLSREDLGQRASVSAAEIR